MSTFFKGLKPERVWHHFKEIGKIPHGPGNEDGIRKYIADFAEKNGFEYYYKPDVSLTDYGQRVVVVYKKATPGLENKPTVVLQSHLDMVCVPNDQIFPLKLQYCDSEGQPGNGWVKAGGYTDSDGTSLGADDGIGVAIVLAILEETEGFGPIEGFFTVKEETGMDGARDFDPGLLKGRVYINLDEEELQTITYGCAGGLRSTYHWKLNWEKVPNNRKCFNLKISGLKGGHSGISIHLGRANAIKLVSELIDRAAREKIDFNISDFSGGNIAQSNVIPGSAQVTLIVKAEDGERFTKLVTEIKTSLHQQYQTVEDNLQVEWRETEIPVRMVDGKNTGKIIDALMEIPHGVMKMSAEREETVETSTNLAAIAMNDQELMVVCMHRSSLESGLDWMKELHKNIAEKTAGRISVGERYPAWTPNENSELLRKAKNVYNDQFNGNYSTRLIHAGLECSWIVDKYRNNKPMDCIAVGPTVLDPHSRRERLEIESVPKVYECVLGILRAYAKEDSE